MIPELEHHCGSWVVCNKASGAVILETFDRRTAERVNQSKYSVETAAQYLGRLNNKIRSEQIK